MIVWVLGVGTEGFRKGFVFGSRNTDFIRTVVGISSGGRFVSLGRLIRFSIVETFYRSFSRIFRSFCG